MYQVNDVRDSAIIVDTSQQRSINGTTRQHHFIYFIGHKRKTAIRKDISRYEEKKIYEKKLEFRISLCGAGSRIRA